MPRATVLKTTERKPLLTLPAGEDGTEEGWVELRRMSFGEKLDKDAEAMKMRFDVSEMDDDEKNVGAEVAMINAAVTAKEFAKCIMDHNLEDENGMKLNFNRPEHVRGLDPRVGQEIQDLIAEMNDFERASKKSVVDAEGKS